MRANKRQRERSSDGFSPSEERYAVPTAKRTGSGISARLTQEATSLAIERFLPRLVPHCHAHQTLTYDKRRADYR